MKNIKWEMIFNGNKCSFTTPKLPKINTIKEEKDKNTMDIEYNKIPVTFELTDISESKIEGTPSIMFGKSFPKESPIVMSIEEFIERCKDNAN